MTSVLVTGGAGYIGSHAVKALRAQGTHVVVYDDLSAGHREAARHASALVVADIHDTARLRAVMSMMEPIQPICTPLASTRRDSKIITSNM